MTRKELICAAVDVLRENNIAKPIRISKQVFTITAPDGHESKFVVASKNKEAIYTVNDVDNILSALSAVAVDQIKKGGSIHLSDLGTLRLHYRERRETKHPRSGEVCDVPARYVPKFDYSNNLRNAANIYNAKVFSESAEYEEPEPIYEEEINGCD